MTSANHDMANGEGHKSDNVSVGSKAQLRMLQERYKDGSKQTVTRDEYKPLDFDKNAEYALVALESFKEDDTLDEHSLKINSPTLLALLRLIIVSHPSVASRFDQPFKISEPFQMLIHHWDDLRVHRATLDDSSIQAVHLDLLLEFMDNELATVHRRCSDSMTKKVVSFNDLWMIYRPGDVLNAPERGHAALLKLENTAYEHESCTGWRFELRCSHPFLDGEKFVKRRKTITIYERKHIPGKTLADVMSLPAYPRSFMDDGPELEERLEARGRRYAEMVGTPCMYHDGLTLYCKTPPSSFFHWDLGLFETVWLPTTESARVVLDPKTFLEDFNDEAESIEGAFGTAYQEWAEKAYDSLSQAQHILSPPFTYGYSLSEKLWCRYFVDNLNAVQWDDTKIKSLILPSSEKSLLSALVSSHRFPSAARDVSAQKGKGLVILLHGTPGSGKTLTAEVSAELAHAPLMPISLRELYEGADFDELRLKAFLTYATIWNAVVLIDEADVFLETRGSGDKASAERNALVAVFLRYLEYFSGVMFLTSNRVEDMDAAVKSRIHLALKYDPPAEQLREQIWTQQLSSLDDELDIDLVSEIPRLIEHDMNGREIANCINTALTIARSENGKMRVEHLEKIIEVWGSFNRNLVFLQEEKVRRKQAGKDLSIVEVNGV